MKLSPLLELIFVRMMLVTVFIIFPIFVVWGVWTIFTNDAAQKSNRHMQQLVWVEQSKDAVRGRLKDLKSAEFKEVFFNRVKGTPMVCGQVNSKNSLGGYTGYQRFVASGNTLAFFERETQDFPTVWNKYCVK